LEAGVLFGIRVCNQLPRSNTEPWEPGPILGRVWQLVQAVQDIHPSFDDGRVVVKNGEVLVQGLTPCVRQLDKQRKGRVKGVAQGLSLVV